MRVPITTRVEMVEDVGPRITLTVGDGAATLVLTIAEGALLDSVKGPQIGTFIDHCGEAGAIIWDAFNHAVEVGYAMRFQEIMENNNIEEPK